MNPNQALWEKGDFTRVALSMRKSGASIVDRLGITKGTKILDLGCGDGTTALPEAILGADVLGVDIASNLVAAGKTRAAEAGLANCRFQQGDASDLRDLREDIFRCGRKHIWRHVCAETVRRGQRDGARKSIGRANRNGKLDSE